MFGGTRKARGTTWVFHSAGLTPTQDGDETSPSKEKDTAAATSPLSSLTVLNYTDFERWFEKRLFLKYSHGLESVLSAIRTLLMIWTSLQDRAMELGEHLDTSRHPVLNAYKVCADNIIHLVDSVAANFPICIDYSFLRSFVETNKEAITAIVVHMHPFDHVANDITDSSLLRPVQLLVSRIHQNMSHLPSALESLIFAIDSSSPLTKKLAALKELFKAPIQNLVDDVEYIENRQELLDDYESARDKYLECESKYKSILRDEMVSKGLGLKEKINGMEMAIDAMLEPYPKAYQLIKTKGKKLDGPVEGSATISKFIILLQGSGSTSRSSLLQIIYESFDDFAEFIQVITELAVQNMHVFPRKQQQILQDAAIHSQSTFRKKFDEWAQLTKQLETLEALPTYSKKQEEFKDASSSFENSLKQFNTSVGDMQKCISVHNRVIENYNYLRYHISKCCLSEFGERIELSVPGIDGPNVMLWTGGDSG